MKASPLFCLLLCLLLETIAFCGCAKAPGNAAPFIGRDYTYADVQRCVAIGTPAEEVAKMFGKPTHANPDSEGGKNSWTYVIDLEWKPRDWSMCEVDKWHQCFEGFTVLFQKGKVVRLEPNYIIFILFLVK